MSEYIVYKHKNNINGKCYFGITSQAPQRRWKNGNGYYENEHFSRAIKKYGWDNFTHEIIAEGLTKEEACALEKTLIKTHHSNNPRFGYNKSSGGENPAEGTTMSAETREKMRESHKGLKKTEEQRKHMSEAAKKRGNGKNGKYGSQCGKTGLVRQINIETGETIAEYYGFYEMSRMTGFGIVPVRRAAYGTQRQSHGYKWEYIPRRLLNVVVR